MKKIFFIIFLISFTINSFSQDKIAVDSNYLEDQLYVGFAYNFIINTHSINDKSIRSGIFSNTLSFGFIKDIPFNKRRNIGMGLGLGINYSNYYSNIKIIQSVSGAISSSLIDITEEYTLNKISLTQIDIPIEFRYRTSTATEFDFYRIYTGMVFSYVINEYNQFQDKNIDVRYYNNNISNKFQYGINLLLGWGPWNIFAFYNLTNIYSTDFKINNSNIKISNLSIGLKYYIL